MIGQQDEISCRLGRPVFHEFLPKMTVILGNLGMKFGAQSVAQDDIILAKVLDFVSGNGLSRYFSII